MLQFSYGDEQITFERLPRSEGIQRVLIKVHPDCRIEVAAPARAVDAESQCAVVHRPRQSRKTDRREDVTEVRPELSCNHTDDGESADRMCSNPVVPAL